MRPRPGPDRRLAAPVGAGPPGGSPGAVTPGAPLNLGPPTSAVPTPITTSAGPGTPAGTAPGEGPGRGAGQGAGNGDSHPGGGGGSGSGLGHGNGAGEGPGGGNEGGEGSHHSKLADQEKPVVTYRGTAQPKYPASAQADGVQGNCEVKILVGETGQVLEVEVTRSAGDRRLDTAAKEWVRHFRYRPAVQNGEPRRVWTTYTVRFELR